MKLIHSIILGALFLANALQAETLGFTRGPFSMQINVDKSYYSQSHRDILEVPICHAISNQKRLDMIVEGKEKVSDKEFKIVTKRLLIDPYAFGLSKEGKPFLHGTVVEDRLIKEVTIKYGEGQLDEDVKWIDKKESRGGWLSGWFKSDKGQNINIDQLTNLYVVSDSHFEKPKDYKGFSEANIRIICELPKS